MVSPNIPFSILTIIVLIICVVMMLLKMYGVSKNEVHQALLSFISGKSPGPDSLNAEFSRFFWDDIGDHLYSAVRYFFYNSIMPRTWVELILLCFLKTVIPSLFQILVRFLCAIFVIKLFPYFG